MWKSQQRLELHRTVSRPKELSKLFSWWFHWPGSTGWILTVEQILEDCEDVFQSDIWAHVIFSLTWSALDRTACPMCCRVKWSHRVSCHPDWAATSVGLHGHAFHSWTGPWVGPVQQNKTHTLKMQVCAKVELELWCIQRCNVDLAAEVSYVLAWRHFQEISSTHLQFRIVDDLHSILLTNAATDPNLRYGMVGVRPQH